MKVSHVSEKRFYVKIEAGKAAGGNPCIYHNKDFPFELFMKWKWYFDYRAALYKVKHPRHYVVMFTGSYDYLLPEEEAIKKLNDKIIGKKRIITKNKNLIQKAKQSWNELFPIEDFPHYQRAVAKIQRIEKELEELQTNKNYLV